MTKEQENKEFDELYAYVKKEILNYPDGISLPKHLVMRLKGLRDGKFIANKKTQSKADYPYSTILITFKFCKSNIINAISTKKFKNEQMRINYIMAIVENCIADVVLRLRAKEKAKSEAEKQVEKIQIEMPIITNHSINNTIEQNNIKTDNEKSNFENLVGDMW